MSFTRTMKIAALGAVVCGATSGFGLTFNFTYDSSVSAQALAGFQAAGASWSNLFTDNVTVNIKIGYRNLGGGILGQSSSTYQTNSYSAVRNALASDQKTANDAIAVSNLQAGSTLTYKTNRFSNNPNGFGSATPYTATASNMDMTSALAKALGLRAGNNTALDATIEFSSAFSWDFNQSDGITSGKFDFIGIAEHEIGHALGFSSGVDFLDYYGSSFADNTYAWIEPLDLFRMSAGNTVPYLTADKTAKYFSLDKGATGTSFLFSTGDTYGDGNQASHWKDDLGLGTMDPTANYGELLLISNLDKTAFDVIGWDLKPVPEPATIATLTFGALALIARRRRRK